VVGDYQPQPSDARPLRLDSVADVASGLNLVDMERSSNVFWPKIPA
jgi:hypothetical protein